MTDHASRPGALPSLPEVHRSIAVPQGGANWRRWLAFAGPGFMVAVGYMDPGNWATDLAGGSKYGYSLIWVIFISNLMAILLQTLCARLGLVTGRDLAQSCRDYYKRPAAVALWLLCEIAIVACDLAEVIGSAVALNLIFGLPLLWGVIVTALDVLVLLGLTRFGFRTLEAVVLTLVGTVAGCFVLNIFLCKPDWHAAALGLVRPTLPNTGDALVVSLGILGATVMPHNLYLHSSVVQTRAYGKDRGGLRQAIKYNTLDTVLSLGAAFFVNAAILVLAAAAFHRNGIVVEELQQAHGLLRPLLGGAAATAFAVALLASGQSSTITGTLAGQIVMEGFLNIRIAPWLRRLITRSLAVIPAILLIQATGGKDTVELLVLSQVVLSVQLSFATFPLVQFTSDPRRMGEFANPLWMKIAGYGVAVFIMALNIYLLAQTAYGRYGVGGLWGLGVLALGMILFAGWVKFIYKEPQPRGTAGNITPDFSPAE